MHNCQRHCAALTGAIAIYLGIRFTLTCKISIVSEGGGEAAGMGRGARCCNLGTLRHLHWPGPAGGINGPHSL